MKVMAEEACNSHLSIAVKNIMTKATSNRKSLFGLIVLESESPYLLNISKQYHQRGSKY